MAREDQRVWISRVIVVSKVAKIAVMLTVYLLWICGNSAIAISCHANSDQHTHCCKSCECHHEGCDKPHVETPHACHHDHSNRIALYSIKKNNLNIEPIALCISAQLEDNLSIEDFPSATLNRLYERKIPITPPPTLLRRGLRAPPVIA